MKSLIKTAACVIAALSALSLGVAAACAESVSMTLSAINNGGTVTVERQEGMSESIIVTCFDENGTLAYATTATTADGQYTAVLPDTYSSLKAFDINKEIYEIDMKNVGTEAPAPTTAITEAPLASPETTASPSPTRKPLNPSYPNELEQKLAPGVVKRVETAMYDGEDVYKLTMLLQGVEVTVKVENDVVIEKAPSAYSETAGMDALALKKGDVVYLRTDLSGKIVKGLELIYRPSNILKGSSGFGEFFTGGSLAHKAEFGKKFPSERTYALGVVTDKNNNVLTLYPGDGSGENMMEIEYTDDTVTYIYDLASKDDPHIAASGAIPKSSIPKRAYDGDENITFSDEYEYSFALVRLVERTAVDIVVYENAEY